MGIPSTQDNQDLQIVYAFLRGYGILISEIKLGGNQYGEIHSLREAFQEGKAHDRSGSSADLGRAEPSHPEA